MFEMEYLLFLVLIIAFGVLAFGHRGENKKYYRLFLFGFLVSLLYASLFVVYSASGYGYYLVFIVILTSLAVMTQYLHIRAVTKGFTKKTKMIVDVAKDYDLEKDKKK